MAQPTVGTETGATSTTSDSSVSNQVNGGPAEAETSANGPMPNGSVAETQVAETAGNPPSPNDITVIHVTPGQPVDLPIDPAQLANAQIQIVGGDLEIKLADGHIFLLVGFVDAEKAGNAPEVAFEGGEHMAANDVLALAGTTLEDLLQTAAGGPQAGTGTANTGASFRHGFGPGLIDGLHDQGPIGPTALQYGVPEPLTGPLDKQNQENDQRPLLQWHIEGDTLVHEPVFGQKQEGPIRELLISEGEHATYTVFYTGGVLAPGQSVTISVATGAGHHDNYPDATGGSDYGTVDEVLTFTGGGATFQTLTVEIFGDTAIEGTEDYSVNLSGQSHGTIVEPTADTDIVDETTGPFWSITGTTEVNEGSDAIYTVSYNGATLENGQTAIITVATGTAGGGSPDATADTDYSSLTTVLTFTAGQTAQTVSVETITDTAIEGTEDYQVEISNPDKGFVSQPTVTTDILDNGASPQWSITGTTQLNEGEFGTYTVSYTGATLENGESATITVATGDNSGGDPDATAGSDYSSISTV